MPQYRPLNADHPVYNGVFHIRDNVAGQVDHVSDTCDDTYSDYSKKVLLLRRENCPEINILYKGM